MTPIAGSNPNATVGCRNELDSNILSILGETAFKMLVTALPNVTHQTESSRRERKVRLCCDWKNELLGDKSAR